MRRHLENGPDYLCNIVADLAGTGFTPEEIDATESALYNDPRIASRVHDSDEGLVGRQFYLKSAQAAQV